MSKAIRDKILLLLEEHGKTGSPDFVDGNEIAEQLGYPVAEIERQLDILESQGFITAANSFEGNHARISPRGSLEAEKIAGLSQPPQSASTSHNPTSAHVTGGVTSPRKDIVFVVHGRNLKARNALFDFLRSIGLRPLEWSQAIALTGKPSPMIAEILDAAFAKAHAVVILMTGDDEVRLSRELLASSDPNFERELTPQARPNVLFEAGLALGRSPNHTIFVEVGLVKSFSDNVGRHVVRITENPATRKDLVNRLRLAGCEIDDTGTDWLSAGDFSSSIRKGRSSSLLPTGDFASNAQQEEPPPWLPADDLASNDQREGPYSTRQEPADIPRTKGWLPTEIEVAEPYLSFARNFMCGLIRKDKSYWIFAWRLEVVNRSRGATKYRVEIRFENKTGLLLDNSTINPAAEVNPMEYKSFSGSIRIDATLAPEAVKAIAIVSHN